MGIFSFGKKKDDDAPSRREPKSGSQAVCNERVGRRMHRAERLSDAIILDPALSEKQQARRRLVGAITLIIAAVVVLPMFLDSHPKLVTDDIAIDIPNMPAHASPSHEEDPVETQTGVANEFPASGGADDTQTAQSATLSPNSSDANAALGPPKPVEQQAATKPAGARFAVQLGSFPDETTARSWADKLKAAGMPAYVEHRNQADGSATALLRVGPFADRAAASAAIAKVRDANLTE